MPIFFKYIVKYEKGKDTCFFIHAAFFFYISYGLRDIFVQNYMYQITFGGERVILLIMKTGAYKKNTYLFLLLYLTTYSKKKIKSVQPWHFSCQHRSNLYQKPWRPVIYLSISVHLTVVEATWSPLIPHEALLLSPALPRIHALDALAFLLYVLIRFRVSRTGTSIPQHLASYLQQREDAKEIFLYD